MSECHKGEFNAPCDIGCWLGPKAEPSRHWDPQRHRSDHKLPGTTGVGSGPQPSQYALHSRLDLTVGAPCRRRSRPRRGNGDCFRPHPCRTSPNRQSPRVVRSLGTRTRSGTAGAGAKARAGARTEQRKNAVRVAALGVRKVRFARTACSGCGTRDQQPSAGHPVAPGIGVEKLPTANAAKRSTSVSKAPSVSRWPCADCWITRGPGRSR